ncbi:MAG: amidase [Thermoleophilia bacterium]|nr:amidase [Thermoleophilia bacterium]
MDDLDIAFAGIARQAKLLRNGEITSPRLVDIYLRRIERLNPRINAFNAVFSESARAEAVAAQQRIDAGEQAPLLGVPIAIKDNIDIAGTVTSLGTSAFSEPAAADCEMVRRLRDAGAVIIGKTALPEFAMYGHFCNSRTWGITRNPWNTGRAPGGSSGGSAAAVAAGLVGAAMASDGGGSIRLPAAHCGLFGLKPQRGRVSLMPHAQHWTGLSVLGSVTRSVADSALFLDVVAGHVDGDAHTAAPPTRPFAEAAAATPRKLRVGVSMKPAMPGTPVHRQVKDAVARTAALLRELGHEVSDAKIHYPLLLPRFLPRYVAGVADDASGGNLSVLEERSRRAAGLGRHGLTRRLVQRSIADEDAVRAKLAPVFARYDVLLMPTIARPIGKADSWFDKGFFSTMPSAGRYVAFTAFWNYTGQPAASLPCGVDRNGLPLAVQLVGRDNDEDTLLSVAAQIEHARPWAGRRPAIADEPA